MHVLVVLCVLGMAVASPLSDFVNHALDAHWKDYVQQYNKQYTSEIETNMRRLIWEKNLKFIQEHNLKADMGHYKYWLGINELADLTDEEFAMQKRGFIMQNVTTGSSYLSLANVQLPDEIDWRTKGYVTPVKNQGQCGSCWAFSSTGSLEGQLFRKTGKLVSLSEQQLVDCVTKNNGCNGGFMVNSFDYIKENGGIDTEACYPYVAQDEQCHFDPSCVAGTDTGYTNIPQGDEQSLMEAVGTVGPVSVAIDASQKTFGLYRSGVYTDTMCSSTQLDHAVLAAGYGEENGEKYWLVKNSWGESWGEQGYIKMRKDYGNMCGIASMASYPLV